MTIQLNGQPHQHGKRRTPLWLRPIAFIAATFPFCYINGHAVYGQAPELTRVFPAGGAPNTSVEIVLTGKFPKWPIAIHSSSPLVQFEPSAENGKITAKISPECPPQIVWIRLHDTSGATQAHRFVIGNGIHRESENEPLIEIVESEPNNTTPQSQPTPQTPSTINGVLEKSGDVDLFKIELKKGEHIALNLFAERSLRSAVDASLQLLDAQGFVVAQNLDTFGLDPFIFYEAKSDGVYHVRIFGFPAQPDSTISFAGNPNWIYRLQVTKPSQISWLSMIPSNELMQRDVSPSINRTEPTSLVVPAAYTGTLKTSGEKHYFRFQGKSGTNYRFETSSQEYGSSMDPVVTIEDASQKSLVNQDDLQEKRDPRIEWRCPTDGEFILTVSDLHKGFGPNCFYQLTASEQQPNFDASIATDLFQGTIGKEIEIPITIDRKLDFADSIRFEISGAGEIAAQNSPISKKGEDSAKKVVLKFTLNQPFQGPLIIRAVTLMGESATGEKAITISSDDKPLWLSVKAD